MTASEKILQKALVGSKLDSRMWNGIQAGLRDRAFFSSQVESARILHAARELSAQVASGDLSLSDFRLKLRHALDLDHYNPEDKRGTIKDLLTARRLDVIVKTNVAQARGYVQHLQATNEGALLAYPCYELVRVAQRKQPRDWAARWRDAGGRFFGGRMIATKTDPIWTRISAFGNPFPPFDWGSGMGLDEVGYAEAVKLGVIERGQKIEPPKIDFNGKLEATVPFKGHGDDLEWQRLKDAFGDQIQRKGDVIAWRTDWFKEAFDDGNFTIRLGKIQPGLSSKLPQDCEFNGWQETQLAVNQDWLNNTRNDGTDHRSHFNGYGSDKVPLEKGDIEILPSLWRNPDRAWLDTRKGHEGRNGVPRLILELDAFDGNTFRAVVDIGTNTPTLKTFYKKAPVDSNASIQAGGAAKPLRDIGKSAKGGDD